MTTVASDGSAPVPVPKPAPKPAPVAAVAAVQPQLTESVPEPPAEPPTAAPAAPEATPAPTSEEWPHHWIDFHDDRLGVRQPTEAAQTAISIALTDNIPGATQLKATSHFLQLHLSEDSWWTVVSKMMNPDPDKAYTLEVFRELVQAIMTVEKDAEAAAGAAASSE